MTPTPAYDFAAADASVDNWLRNIQQQDVLQAPPHVFNLYMKVETIRFALKLAAKVMQPSDAMTDAGETAYYTADTELASIPDAFTAMISQACAEITTQKD